MRRSEDEFKGIYNRDMKNYRAQEDEAMFIKGSVWLVIALIIIAAIAYVSESDYQECLAGNQSVALCGGGNTK
jgi:hypothetical protein